MVCELGWGRTQGVTGVKPVGFHPTSVDCGLVPVLNLWLLAKVSDLSEASHRPPTLDPQTLFKKYCSSGQGRWPHRDCPRGVRAEAF